MKRLLDRIRDEVAAGVSVGGAGAPPADPEREALEMLEAAGAQISSTSIGGAIPRQGGGAATTTGPASTEIPVTL